MHCWLTCGNGDGDGSGAPPPPPLPPPLSSPASEPCVTVGSKSPRGDRDGTTLNEPPAPEAAHKAALSTTWTSSPAPCPHHSRRYSIDPLRALHTSADRLRHHALGHDPPCVEGSHRHTIQQASQDSSCNWLVQSHSVTVNASSSNRTQLWLVARGDGIRP